MEDSNTLDEPIISTLLRDLKAIGRKIAIVAVPCLGRDNELRDWDLWGPLLLCLIMAIVLGSNATSEQSGTVFSAVFALVWLGSAVVTLNAKFLGAKLSFFQIVCVMGYCIAPMVLAALLSLAIPTAFWYVKTLLIGVAWLWSTWGSLRFFRGCVKPAREVLVVYPLCLFYSFMSWMVAVGI